MCGRFFLDSKNREIDRLLEQLPPEAPPVKTGDVFPTDLALTLITGNENIIPAVMSWGFPRWDGKGVVFNARAETALAKPMFAKSLRQRPCAVPTCGFYEWQAIAGSKRKNKFLFTAEQQSVLYIAGFWNRFADTDFKFHFTLLTTAANESMSSIHNRMPVLLRHEELEDWCSGKNLQSVLQRVPFALRAEKVT